jgi:hypothetical protein
MKAVRLIDNYLVWVGIQASAMAVGFVSIGFVLNEAGVESAARSFTAATVLLSVAVAIVIQLWVKLNDLSALQSLSPHERGRLRKQIGHRIRALVWLVVFFVGFVFFLLAVCALAFAHSWIAEALMRGVGVGFASSLALIACVLVDLNEVADFRWKVETSDLAERRRVQTLEAIRAPDAGFEGDENIQGYKKVSG